MKALILAAGYATRLYPITKDYPKPLLEIGSQPIIDYIINKLNELNEINEIIVVTNSKFMPFFKQWKDSLKIQKRISLVDDLTKSLQDRRGAVGDMYFAIKNKRIKDDLVVVGGDNLFERNLQDFMAFIKIKKDSPAIGIYNLKDKRKAKRYGVVKLDKKNKIIDFKEKPQDPNSTLVAMCLYYFPKKKLGLIKKYLTFGDFKEKHDATGFYIDWLRKRCSVYGFIFEGCWYDIGDSKFFQEARKKFFAKED